MVRRDADGGWPKRPASARCVSPAGASPASVSAGAPSSRPQASGGDPDARAGRKEPARRQEPRSGERAHGPQHEVKPAASTEEQSGSRAAHVTAKAMSLAGVPEPAGGPGGVGGAARVQGETRNTRGPSARPWSRRARPYKQKAKSGRAQRESEGIVVPVIATANNVAGGKGPWGGRVVGAGKREGMAAKSGPNDPAGRRPGAKVRQLQRRLWAAAKRSPGRRFHALYDHICRGDVLRAYSGRRRPPIPVEGDHRFRSKATTDSNLKATTLGWRAGMVVAIPGMPVAFPGMVVAIRRKL